MPETAVSANVRQSEHGLAVSFTFHEDVELPAHSHGARRGTVLAGQIAPTRDGKEQIIRPGESCMIDAGIVHSARVAAGSAVLDVFEEADRYPIRA